MSQFVTVFLSCPGDMAKAKAALVRVIQDSNILFQPYDLHVQTWYYEKNAVPAVGASAQAVVTGQMPSDYDIYVGLMCRRTGTPTPNALSGTIEEFSDARKRFSNTGKPDILFYFCRALQNLVSDQDADQLTRVREFRNAYPGLFFTFNDIDELVTVFKDHLVMLLLQRLQGSTRRDRAWASNLARAVDANGNRPSYFDKSSECVARIFGKLSGLFDFPSLMRDREEDALLAAQYVRLFHWHNLDPNPLQQELANVYDAAFVDAALTIADWADNNDEIPAASEHGTLIRRAFLAALLRLGDLLDLDHHSVKMKAGRLPAPEVDADVTHWLAYLTRAIRVQRRGIVFEELILPTSQKVSLSAVKRCAALFYEKTYQRLRPALTLNGAAVSRAPISATFSSELESIGEIVLAQFDEVSTRAEEDLKALTHLSGTPQPASLETLLPLPCSAISTTCTFQEFEAKKHQLVLTRDDSAAKPELQSGGDGNLTLSPHILTPLGSKFRWEIVSREFGRVIQKGIVWTLSAEQQIHLSTTADSPSDIRRNGLQLSYGLWNALMTDLWPRIFGPHPDFAACSMAQQVLLASYDWSRVNDPESSRIDTIRNVSLLVRQTLLVTTKGENR